MTESTSEWRLFSLLRGELDNGSTIRRTELSSESKEPNSDANSGGMMSPGAISDHNSRTGISIT